MFKHHIMQTYSGAKECLHTFLVFTMNVSCQLRVSCALFWDRAPTYLSHRKLGGPNSQSECFGVDKTLLPLSKIQPLFLNCPAHRPVMISCGSLLLSWSLLTITFLHYWILVQEEQNYVIFF